MREFDLRHPRLVKAVLGPTNTGKTHLAIDRLLSHSRGMMGFPLRLLARENYDRMVRLKGAKYVGLITGEEKIVPPQARWLSCTVEAMPLDFVADFVAIDEIQLCADPTRGHVFTDRLLNVRGTAETMFLGSETISHLVKELVPNVSIEKRPRLSRLEHSGPALLSKLPARTAIVAFSAEDVYATAELIRRRRGGCAIVMGPLSPRTRNAQVALYQNGEVDFIVATDAIGMGLNLDIKHVAFAGLAKFDGRNRRSLSAAEIAQIAGRAGRGLQNGTFGTISGCEPVPEVIASAIEEHRFEPTRRLRWRNSHLDFQNIDALIESLTRKSPHPSLVRTEVSPDLETLVALARESWVRDLVRGNLPILWAVCQIPDFRQLTIRAHTAFCGRVFSHLTRSGRIPTSWIERQVSTLAQADGDIDALTQKLAGIRVWSYIAARQDWVADAAHWQARTREIEEALSDALHDRLTSRFVDRRATKIFQSLRRAKNGPPLSGVTREGEVVVEGCSVGRLAGLTLALDQELSEDAKKLAHRTVRETVKAEIVRRGIRAEGASDGSFSLSPAHEIMWDGAAVGRLTPGPSLIRPQARVIESEYLEIGSREKLRARLQRFVDNKIQAELAALWKARSAADQDPSIRGWLFLLSEALGFLPIGSIVHSGQVPKANSPVADQLRKIGVNVGRFGIFSPDMLKPRAAAMRAQLLAVHYGVPTPALPYPDRVSCPRASGWSEEYAEKLGWISAGPVLLRVDVAERISLTLGSLSKKGAASPPPDLASKMSIRASLVPTVVRALGFRIQGCRPANRNHYGPPSTAFLIRTKNPTPRIRTDAHKHISAESPFACLANARFAVSRDP